MSRKSQSKFLPTTFFETVIFAAVFGAANQLIEDWYSFVEADMKFDGGEFSRHHLRVPKEVDAAHEFVDGVWIALGSPMGPLPRSQS